MTHSEDCVVIQQHQYTRNMRPIMVAKARKQQKTASLTPEEMTQYLSLTQQLSWPVTTLPGLNYLVSDLQQRTAGALVSDLVPIGCSGKHRSSAGRVGN